MARARSHGAASAAHGPVENEEDVGLLSPSAGTSGAPGLEDENYGDDGIIIHAGTGAGTAAARRPPLRIPSPRIGARQGEGEGDETPTAGRTPRTPNRVRFDLRPTILDEESGDHHHHARESFDIEDDDPLNPSSPPAQGRRESGGHVPLLTGIEAPSVALANSPWTEGGMDDVDAWAEAERVRPKSGMRMAFMNMANSIIGAGIIGQPYAFRQAGLLAGVVLLLVLTVVVDWTICLIVVNSKLSGASSFQGTVEKCFGKPGLIAISVAQWAFAFGGMVAFGVIVGDSIPHVLAAVWPGLRDMPVLGLLADRRAVIVVFTMGVSFPLALYRDIAKVSRGPVLLTLLDANHTVL